MSNTLSLDTVQVFDKAVPHLKNDGDFLHVSWENTEGKEIAMKVQDHTGSQWNLKMNGDGEILSSQSDPEIAEQNVPAEDVRKFTEALMHHIGGLAKKGFAGCEVTTDFTIYRGATDETGRTEFPYSPKILQFICSPEGNVDSGRVLLPQLQENTFIVSNDDNGFQFEPDPRRQLHELNEPGNPLVGLAIRQISQILATGEIVVIN